MIRRLLFLGWLTLAACGGAPTAPPAHPGTEGVQDEAAGVQLRVIARPTEGRVWLSLWVDAGARDAAPLEAAALGAWVATAGTTLEARVLADGIELSTPCRREGLRGCLAALAAALGTREVDPEALASARRRLVGSRRAAVSPTRRADALALAALTEGPVDPLGPSEEASPEAVARFLGQHFGRGRALLVAVGDVEAGALRDAVGETFGDVPLASRDRATRSPRAGQRSRLEVGDAPSAAVASWQPHVGRAASLGGRWVARLGGDASADVFPLREGAVLVVRRGGPDAAARLMESWALLSVEPVAATEAAPADGPRALARWVGAQWIGARGSGGEGEAPLDALGLGVVLDGGRGDALDEEDPDRAIAAHGREAIDAMLAEIAAPPTLDGAVGSDAVDARAENGARVVVRRLPDASRVAIAVRFDGGPARETPPMHGVSALCARAAAVGCGAIAAEELGGSLRAMGARVSPLLDASGWGLTVEGRGEDWATLAHLAVRCAERIPSADALEDARAATLADATRRPLAVESAQALTPSAPGRVAPLGDLDSLSALHLGDVRRWHDGHVVGARARLALVGALDARRGAEHLARLTRRWPTGAAPGARPWDEAPAPLTARTREAGPMAVVMWSAPGNSDDGARAFAEAVGRSLAAEPGLRVAWIDGGATDGRAWAAVALRASPEALDALPGHAARAVRVIAHGWAEIAAASRAREAERRAWSGGGPLSLSLEGVRAAPSVDAEPTVRGLGAATPAFLVARPETAR